jgi:GST-like protein
MEVKRQLDVLNIQLADKEFICGDQYTIADMAIWAWYGAMVLGKLYEAAEFLDVESYTHLLRWAKHIDARDAVKRGKMVNRSWGQPEGQLRQRKDASDFENKTQDKLEPSE